MSKNRLEAFSDGVVAIVITIMILEMKVPHSSDWSELPALWPVFSSYILSFIFVGIYWNNHHHLLHLVKKVNGSILWANMHLLFWLTLVPFTTAWMAETHYGELPVALYGAVLLAAAVAYWMLAHCLISIHGRDSELALALGRDFKGVVSLFIYFAAIPCAFVSVWISCACYVFVALWWLVPDRRIEKFRG